MNLKNLRIMKGEMSDRKSIHEFDCHVYPRKIWVSVAAPLKELNEFFENAYEDMEESADATVSVNRRMNPEAMGGVSIQEQECHDRGNYHSRGHTRGVRGI